MYRRRKGDNNNNENKNINYVNNNNNNNNNNKIKKEQEQREQEQQQQQLLQLLLLLLIQTGVVGVLSQVVHINVHLCSTDKHLQLIVVKRPEPVNVHHVVETTTERLTVRTHLPYRQTNTFRPLRNAWQWGHIYHTDRWTDSFSWLNQNWIG